MHDYLLKGISLLFAIVNIFIMPSQTSRCTNGKFSSDSHSAYSWHPVSQESEAKTSPSIHGTNTVHTSNSLLA